MSERIYSDMMHFLGSQSRTPASTVACDKKRNPSRSWGCQFTGGETRIRTGDKGFAGLCLTTWPSRHMKKAETNPAEKSWSGLRGSNPRPQPWQGCALPTALSPRTRGIIYASLRLSASVNSKIVKLFYKSHESRGAQEVYFSFTLYK